MKKLLCFIWMISVLPVAAYQTRSVSRPQFNTASAAADGQTDQKGKSSAPGQQGVQTRSFTSYSSRAGNAWRQGVQTKTVQTQPVAQTPGVFGKGKEAGEDKDKVNKPIPAKTSAKQETPKAGNSAAENTKKEEKADMAAVSQQMQGMEDVKKQMQEMQAMMGVLGGAEGGSGTLNLPDLMNGGKSVGKAGMDQGKK